jgi:predicted  nucleic acid-binding Zn-ribbon protein
MTEDGRTELRNAAEKLSEARERTSNPDAGDRLDSLAEQVEKLADAERGPDHGRLARLEHNLAEVQEDLDAEAADLVDEALSHERAYRETVEGV